jgi:hypothetical protein
MAAEARVDVHHGAPRCLLGLFDAAADCWGNDFRGLSREELTALIASSTHEIPTTGHRTLHREASDFVRWESPTLAVRSVRLHAPLSFLDSFRRSVLGRSSMRRSGTRGYSVWPILVGIQTQRRLGWD